MVIHLAKKSPKALGVLVEGRHLAPLMHEFDNLDEGEKLTTEACISWEDVSIDPRSGQIHIPRIGAVRIGQCLVCCEGKMEVFDTLSDLQEEYVHE